MYSEYFEEAGGCGLLFVVGSRLRLALYFIFCFFFRMTLSQKEEIAVHDNVEPFIGDRMGRFCVDAFSCLYSNDKRAEFYIIIAGVSCCRFQRTGVWAIKSVKTALSTREPSARKPFYCISRMCGSVEVSEK